MDPWFNKDNYEKLTAELDKFNFIDRPNRMKVYQFMFTTQKSFQFRYLLNPPTIHNLEKSEFQKKYRGLLYLMNLINSKTPLNVGAGVKLITFSSAE